MKRKCTSLIILVIIVLSLYLLPGTIIGEEKFYDAEEEWMSQHRPSGFRASLMQEYYRQPLVAYNSDGIFIIDVEKNFRVIVTNNEDGEGGEGNYDRGESIKPVWKWLEDELTPK